MDLINLSSREFPALERLPITTEPVRQLKHAQALIRLGAGASAVGVAESLRVSRQTVYNQALRFESRSELASEARVAGGARKGRPCSVKEIIDPLIAEAIDQDPPESGYGATIWTAQLMRRYSADNHQIEICSKSVSFTLRRLRIVWKRLRSSVATP
jgi:transposase